METGPTERQTYPQYPSKEWDNFLPQATITLNLLRNFRFNPKFSAYEALHGVFDHLKKPLAPLGTCVIFHEKNHRTWSP